MLIKCGLPPVFVPLGEFVKTVYGQGYSFLGLNLF